MTWPRFPEALDPDEPTGKFYSFDFTLPPGVTITLGEIDLVDASSTVLDPSPIISLDSVAVVNDSDGWHVRGRATGTGISGNAYLRCHYILSDGAPEGDHVTMRLVVAQR